MITITIVNNNQSQITGNPVTVNKLANKFRIRHPNAWHILRYNRTGWDGYIKYISDRGYFKTGLFPKILEAAQEFDDVQVIDRRPTFDAEPDIPDDFHLSDRTLYPAQVKALKKLLNYKIDGMRWTICAGDYAVGFGKSTLFASIFKAYQGRYKTILLLNDSDLFNQFKREIPPMLRGYDVKFIRGAGCNAWGDFNVAMVQSISKNLKSYQNWLSQMSIVLIDEADVIDNKTYSSVITHLWNAPIRIGLSGTLYLNEAKKYEVHNMNIMQFIGPAIDKVSLKTQIKDKRATPVVVKSIQIEPPKNIDLESLTEYQDQYREVIMNEHSYEQICQRIAFNLGYDRIPMLIVVKFIDHCEKLSAYIKNWAQSHGLSIRVAHVHHKSINRNQILDNFREGKIDLLVATTIISRGKNFPDLKYLMNAACMDAHEKTIQILGRLVRLSASKKKTYLDDICYPGSYLYRHSKHRVAYYRKQGFKVIKKILGQ